MRSEIPAPRLLIVEDEPLVRAALCDFLELSGFLVLEAGNADDAVHILERIGDEIDLVVSDIRMPGSMDGFGLADWIRSTQPDLPLILTSGDIGQANRNYKLSPGDIFLPKPYSLDDMAYRIRNMVSFRVH